MTANNPGTPTLSGASSLDTASELAGSRQRKPWQSGLYSKLLLKAADLRLLLIAMETEAKLKEHHADGMVSIHALEGTFCIRVQEQTHSLLARQILTIEPGIKHDLEALEDSALLLTISCPAVKSCNLCHTEATVREYVTRDEQNDRSTRTHTENGSFRVTRNDLV